MLLRNLTDGYLLIPQPSHARVSGQIANAWRDDYSPRNDVALASAIHDIGWSTEENTVVLNQETGMPYDFLNLPKSRHIEIWTQASQLALTFGRYVALMVSRHGTALYKDFDFSSLSAGDAQLLRKYLDDQRGFQAELIFSLRKDKFYDQYITDESLRKNTNLILLFDLISIALCTDFTSKMSFNFPGISMQPLENRKTAIVDPWPFNRDKISLLIEGRKLSGKFNDQAELDTRYETAPWHSFTIELLKA